ncbi:MAG: hypothetical protein ACRD3E_09375 [Terriglobales bacterium]
MKRIAVLITALFLISLSGWAQTQNCGDPTASYTNCRNSQTISTSGNSVTINNYVGAVTSTFEVKIAGAPDTVNVVIQGCMKGGTCDTLDTYTTVADSIRKPTISTVYDKYVVTASWTGGASPSVTVNTTATIARNSSGGGSFATITGLPSDNANLQSALDAKANESELGGLTITLTSPAAGQILKLTGPTTAANAVPARVPSTQTGANYTYLAADRATEVRRSNSGSAMTDTLPDANTTGFEAGYPLRVCNVDATGTLTINRQTSSTINAASSIPISPNTCADFTAGSNNWTALTAGSGTTTTNATLAFGTGTAAITINTTVNYMILTASASPSSTHSGTVGGFPFTGTVTKMCMVNDAATTSTTGNVTFTLQTAANGSLPVDTAAVVTVAPSTAQYTVTCSVTLNVSVTAGQTSNVSVVSDNATGTSLQWHGWLIVSH